MALGPWTWFYKAKRKCAYGVGPIALTSDTFKMGLATSAQALTAAFVGSSGDCRYADLTGELTTASGYTVGGVTMAGITFVETGGVVVWSGSPASWTLSATLSMKYAFIYDDTTANKDLLAFLDFDAGGGSITPSTGAFTITPDPTGGFLNWM